MVSTSDTRLRMREKWGEACTEGEEMGVPESCRADMPLCPMYRMRELSRGMLYVSGCVAVLCSS